MIRKIYIAIYILIYINYIGIKNKFAKNNKEKMKLRIQFSKKIFKLLNIKVIVTNYENIPINKNFILLSNHRSVLDPIIINKALENTNTPFGIWLAKEDLYKSLFFGLFTKNSGTILVPNDTKDLSFLKKCKEEVEKGNSIYIFPEGTRNKKMGEFNKGARVIAFKNKLNYLPIYINGKPEEILKNALKNNKEQKIEVIIGNDFSYKEKDFKNIYLKEFNL